MKKIFVFTILLSTTVYLFATGQNEIQSSNIIKKGITIVDSLGRSVTIKEPALRVVSLAPSITETIFALGRGDILKGRTQYCDYPIEVQNIPSIGSLREPDIEAIAELKPDIVIASIHFTKESLNKLTALSIPVVILSNQNSFEGTFVTIEKISKLIGAEKEGKNIVTEMKTMVEQVKNAVKGKEKPSVYYVIGFGENGDFTAGGNTFINQIIEMAGGNNIASEIDGWSYSLEKILSSDPDILICSKYGNTKNSLLSTNGYKDLTAVQNGNLFEIDNNMLDRDGPRLTEGLKALAKILHPDVF